MKKIDDGGSATEDHSFVRADCYWHNNMKNYFLSAWVLREQRLIPPVLNDSFPFKVEQLLKSRGCVPKDAGMIGYFHVPEKNGILLRFVHRSFEEVPRGAQIPLIGVDFEVGESKQG